MLLPFEQVHNFVESRLKKVESLSNESRIKFEFDQTYARLPSLIQLLSVYQSSTLSSYPVDRYLFSGWCHRRALLVQRGMEELTFIFQKQNLYPNYIQGSLRKPNQDYTYYNSRNHVSIPHTQGINAYQALITIDLLKN